MARRKRQDEHENHERWLVSYADFITLLFAFFVVMYAISSVNEGKYRVLSNTLTEAFVSPAMRMDTIQIGEPVRTLQPQIGESIPAAPEAVEEYAPHPGTETAALSLSQVKQRLEQSLKDYIDKALVNVTRTERGIEVEMKSNMLFTSGSARLSREALKVLRDVAGILKDIQNQIRVEGHTDNVPIRTVTFPSNWELSAARAAAVVHLFARFGVNSARMGATGYGEFHPIGDNKTENGRQKNRRVALIIITTPQEKVRGFIGLGN